MSSATRSGGSLSPSGCSASLRQRPPVRESAASEGTRADPALALAPGALPVVLQVAEESLVTIESATSALPVTIESAVSPPSVVGSCSALWSAWAACGMPARVVEWLRDGFPVKPVAGVSLPGQPHQGAVEDPAWVSAEIARLVAEGAVVECETRPRVLSNIFMVPKAGPKRFRLVVDMRGLNKTLPRRAAKQEGLREVLRLAGKGWWACSWDLASGYHQVRVRPDCQDLLGFTWEGKYYKFTVLPFGLSLSPWAFTRITRSAVARWRRMGIRVLVYIDDFILLARSREDLLRQRAIIEADMAALGLRRDPAKGHWEPTQRLEFLGLTIDLASGQVRPPVEKAKAIASAAQAVLSQARPAVRAVASVAGQLTALDLAWREARVLARPLLCDVARCLPPEASVLWDKTESSEEDRRLVRRAVKLAYSQRLTLTTATVEALKIAVFELRQHMSDPTHLWRAAWRPAHVVELYTDASLDGWGAVCKGVQVAGAWSTADPRRINLLEILAVQRALADPAIIPLIQGRSVVFRVDSQVAGAALRHGSPVLDLHEAASAVWKRCRELGINVVDVEYIRSALNPADGPSRSLAPRLFPMTQRGTRLDDWGLSDEAVARLGPFDVDAFASAHSARCHQFWTDAFQEDWSGQHLLLVPPLRLVHQALAALAQARATGVIVVPEWPAQAWWPLLCDLATSWHRLFKWDLRLVDGYAEPLAQPGWRLWAVSVDGSRVAASWA